MTPEEIKFIAREAAKEAVVATFATLGIDASPEHLQKTQETFLWLRKTHENSVSFRKVTTITALIALVGFFGAVLWDAVAMLGKSIVTSWVEKQ